MKYPPLLIILFIIFMLSCQKPNPKAYYKPLVLNQFKTNDSIIGSVLIYDLNNNTYHSNNFNWAKIGRIPASTYKIPHSLIALELGIVDSNYLLKWSGEKRAFKIWQQDLTLKQAFHYSCVPCYQQIARKVGETRMNSYVDKFEYGHMDIHDENIDNFWLIGESKINQFQQLDFLKRLYLSQLPISKRTEIIFKQMFIAKQTDDYILRAKTGLTMRNDSYNGWYVGYIETSDNVYFFATNISPKDKYNKSFNNKRKNITINAFKQLGIML